MLSTALVWEKNLFLSQLGKICYIAREGSDCQIQHADISVYLNERHSKDDENLKIRFQ